MSPCVYLNKKYCVKNYRICNAILGACTESDVSYDQIDEDNEPSKAKLIVKLKKKACVCLNESHFNDYNNFVWIEKIKIIKIFLKSL